MVKTNTWMKFDFFAKFIFYFYVLLEVEYIFISFFTGGIIYFYLFFFLFSQVAYNCNRDIKIQINFSLNPHHPSFSFGSQFYFSICYNKLSYSNLPLLFNEVSLLCKHQQIGSTKNLHV